MIITAILVFACAGVLAILTSVFVHWSSNRSALFNMAFGIALAFAAIAGAVAIAWMLARAYLPR